MKLLVMLSALVAIGLHVRVIKSPADPQFRRQFVQDWNNASVLNRALMAGEIALPFAFYGFCLATSRVDARRWWLTLGGAVICVLVFPFFMRLHDVNPMVARSAGSTALLAIPRYLCLPGRPRTNAAHLDEGDE